MKVAIISDTHDNIWRLAKAIEKIGQVVEGVNSAAEVQRLALQHKVNMPISEQVNGIVHNGWNPIEGVARLLAREQKAEHGE